MTTFVSFIRLYNEMHVLQVLPYSTLNETLCRCEAGAGNVFASSFFVPNMIDFHSVWSKFDVNNAAIYGTLIALFVLYVAGMVYLRRKDKIDQIKVSFGYILMYRKIIFKLT